MATILTPTIPPPISTGNNWFDLDGEKSDLENVLNFLDTLPSKLKAFFEEPFFTAVFEKTERYHNISRFLFFSGLEEAAGILRDEVDQVRARISSSNLQERERATNEANETLRRIGFTGQSLILKSTMLNQLAIEAKKPKKKGLIGFLKSPFVKGTRAFLGFLNSILRSFFSFVPGVDAISEIKDTGEAAMSLTD